MLARKEAREAESELAEASRSLEIKCQEVCGWTCAVTLRHDCLGHTLIHCTDVPHTINPAILGSPFVYDQIDLSSSVITTALLRRKGCSHLQPACLSNMYSCPLSQTRPPSCSQLATARKEHQLLEDEADALQSRHTQTLAELARTRAAHTELQVKSQSLQWLSCMLMRDLGWDPLIYDSHRYP